MFDFFFNDPNPLVKKKKDDRISATIKSLLNDFFSQNRVLIHICESLDGKGRFRSKVFKDWFRGVEDSYRCNHLEIDVTDMDPNYGAVFRSNEFQQEELLEAEIIKNVDKIVMEKFGLAP
jgi:hypothetical protein